MRPGHFEMVSSHYTRAFFMLKNRLLCYTLHNMTSKYNSKELQKKWEDIWEAQKIYQPDLVTANDPYYVLYMFPYPSAEGLHVGHAFSGTGSDVYARFMRMKGRDVFHPMGFDAFGIHSENFALKINDHPQNLINRATKHFKEQFDSLGFSYDWTHSVNTSSPDYYKWTQWLFIQLFKAGLAEKKKAEVNWCPSCLTVLADEQVLSGECERCGSIVERKLLEQWFFKITKYADKLLEGLDRIDWTEKVLLAQRNWIGKSEGQLINFKVDNEKHENESIEVFTTKPETLDGATFLVLSPEHKFLENVESSEVQEYIRIAKNNSKDNIEKEKTGVFTGFYAINPVTNNKIPIWVADYVLSGYGTGAIMAVPWGDERDKEFAVKYNLPIVETNFSARPKGEKRTNYHLRDWLISRQRYWGAPIPMIYCPSCAKASEGKDNAGWQPVPEDQLPVELPYIENFKPLGTGVAPLAQDENFVNTKCPSCGGPAKRETDVADTFLDSSWYFLRYPSVGNDRVAFDPELTKKWLPVPMYIGGAEHSVLHLLYSRFITKVLFDLKFLEFDEPFTKFRAHGLIIKDGSKMSKSKGNVVNPDEYIEKYGADTLRAYLMFLGPFDQGGDFRDSGIEGMERFLKRARKLVEENLATKNQSEDLSAKNSSLNVSMNKAIKEVGFDIENLRYNTAISKIMVYVNDLTASKESIEKKHLEILLILLAPFAPYLTEELWTSFGNEKSIHITSWPEFDESLLVEDEVNLAIQVNGKLRATIMVSSQLNSQEDAEKLARDNQNVSKYLESEQIKKVIYVPGKILNFVVS